MNFTHDKALLIWPLFNHKIHETQSTWGHTSNFIPTGPVIWHLTGRVWHVYWGRVKKLNMSGSQAINLIHLLQQKICHDRQAVNCIYIAHLILFWFLSSLLWSSGKGKGKGGRPRKVTQRSFKDGGWWMVDILSLMLYTKFGCHPPYSRLLNQTFKNPPPQF